MKKILSENQQKSILSAASKVAYDGDSKWRDELHSVLTSVDEAEKRLAELEPKDLRTEELTFNVTYDANVLSLEKVTEALEKILKDLPFTGIDLIREGPRSLKDKEQTLIKNAINHCWQAWHLYGRENNHESAKIVSETISGLHNLLTPTEVTEELTGPASPGEGFRYVNSGEILQEGDQCINKYTNEWECTSLAGNEIFSAYFYRRRLN